MTSPTVDDIATKGVVTIPRDANPDDARREMARREIDQLVVVDSGRIGGIISKTDL